ncbi:DUF2203 domain-containing protein [Micromonospora sp. AB353]|uniref:DUF2203 domain-containing protein n=1 Tax=Micromonospora sp. AB353 TaxID=3413282 RepID=UPI003C1AF529
MRVDLADHGVSALGGLAEVKALEARLHVVVDEFHQHEIAVKGIAPVLLDFPGERDGRAVLWCWLEGDTDIRWYHRVECGFAGRRPARAALSASDLRRFVLAGGNLRCGARDRQRFVGVSRYARRTANR